MTKKITTLLLVFLTLNFYAAAQNTNNYTKLFDAAKMKNRVKELSSDRYNGRSPSDKLAAEFIAGELKKIGAKPANKGSYFQNVKLFGTKSNSPIQNYSPAVKLLISATIGLDLPTRKSRKFRLMRKSFLSVTA